MDDAGATARVLAADLEAGLPATLALTERLVAVESGSHDTAGVSAVGRMVGEELARAGFTVEREATAGRGDLVRAGWRGGDGPALLVLGHSDTVWPAGTAAGWPFARHGDSITGPGVGDMKACLAMACAALRALIGRGLLAGRMTVLLVPDEELGSTASRPAIEREARAADACLCLEAATPGGGVIVSRGAVGAMVVRAAGPSRHVTDPGGRSAVAALAPLVEQLESLGSADRSAAVTVGTFHGGTARQVVPAAAELHVDLRAPDAESAAGLERRVRELALEAATDEVQVEVEGGITRPAFSHSPGTELLYGVAERACAALGEPLFARSERGGSDASFAAALGVPTLDGLGPVCHDSCSTRERVDVPSVVGRGAMFGAVASGARVVL